MRKMTFSELQEATDRRYGPLSVVLPDGEVRLLHLLGLPAERRSAVMQHLQDMTGHQDGDGAEDVDGVIADARRLVELTAQSPQHWARLRVAVEESDAPDAMWMALLEQWQEATGPGEAPASSA